MVSCFYAVVVRLIMFLQNDCMTEPAVTGAKRMPVLLKKSGEFI